MTGQEHAPVSGTSGFPSGRALSARPDAGVVMVAVTDLLAADSPRTGGDDLAHVRNMAESATELPPIIVHRATMRVIDGMHRLRAVIMRGGDRIAARFFDGSAEEAFVVAVHQNAVHGLPLSNADRTAAAGRILRSHPQWSDRRIAEIAGLSDKTVGAIRRRLPVNVSGQRIGRDGRARPVSARAGRLRAGELLARRPDAPLREVAAQAGIALSTARDVRRRLSAGEGPIPPKRPRVARPRTPVAGPGPAGHEATPVSVPVQTGPGDVLPALRELARDPALRATVEGRAVLRLLSLHTQTLDHWERLIVRLPPHSRTAVARLARHCARTWDAVARRLEGHRAAERP
ncbi:ParB N-terminal domain-containing protein [Amycolatopsis sp. lyj-23]|uniref:ParB/RepB/Spo0J family partition protein n=1 Tax=Amycolatopsis sp. lyj-23 TaxID=2789283 RepID=UPI00397BEF73